MDICSWLRKTLKPGPMDVRAVKSAAKLAGYSKGELREAKLLCRVKSVHVSKDVWIWSLPED